MLSDRERERLREIQRRFMTEDPDFVREFGARPEQPTTEQPTARQPYLDGYSICIISAVSLSVLMLLAGSPAVALLLAISAGLISAAQRRGRHD
jgi:hypothetical protein